MLVSLSILIALKYIIYHQKWFDDQFPKQVQSYKSIQLFIEILANKTFTVTNGLISQLFFVTFIHSTYV